VNRSISGRLAVCGDGDTDGTGIKRHGGERQRESLRPVEGCQQGLVRATGLVRWAESGLQHAYTMEGGARVAEKEK
jgi:hypothetical protein